MKNLIGRKVEVTKGFFGDIKFRGEIIEYHPNSFFGYERFTILTDDGQIEQNICLNQIIILDNK